jgi:hypothetical protein
MSALVCDSGNYFQIYSRSFFSSLCNYTPARSSAQKKAQTIKGGIIGEHYVIALLYSRDLMANFLVDPDIRKIS